jgi:hypothetical protein
MPFHSFDSFKKLAKSALTEDGYGLFIYINSKLPNIWDRYSSSTMKYHKRHDGTVPTILEHTYEMVYAAVKIISMWGNETISKRNDAFLLGIIFHDMLKYGKTGKNPHTTRNHDQEMANLFVKNKKIFLKHFDEDEFNLFIACIRFHSGRWSPDAKGMQNVLHQLPVECVVVHMLDMLSTKSCLLNYD